MLKLEDTYYQCHHWQRQELARGVAVLDDGIICQRPANLNFDLKSHSTRPLLDTSLKPFTI